MTEAFTLYKLIILYSLNKVSTPMTSAQICDLMLDMELTSYFKVQEAMSEMTASGLLSPKKIRNMTQYTLTKTGEDTLQLFLKDIPLFLRKDVDAYLKEHAFELRNTVSHPAEYVKNARGEYAINCRILENTEEIFAMSVLLPTEEAAKKACESWDKQYEELYSHLLSRLLKLQ